MDMERLLQRAFLFSIVRNLGRLLAKEIHKKLHILLYTVYPKRPIFVSNNRLYKSTVSLLSGESVSLIRSSLVVCILVCYCNLALNGFLLRSRTLFPVFVYALSWAVITISLFRSMRSFCCFEEQYVVIFLMMHLPFVLSLIAL